MTNEKLKPCPFCGSKADKPLILPSTSPHISRKEAIKMLDDYVKHFDKLESRDYCRGMRNARRELTVCPKSADVAPVVHAHWEISSDGYYPYCPVCHSRPDKMTNFCPNCGADMRGDKK